MPLDFAILYGPPYRRPHLVRMAPTAWTDNGKWQILRMDSAQCLGGSWHVKPARLCGDAPLHIGGYAETFHIATFLTWVCEGSLRVQLEASLIDVCGGDKLECGVITKTESLFKFLTSVPEFFVRNIRCMQHWWGFRRETDDLISIV